MKGREDEWVDTVQVVWSEVTGLCGFWDGSCDTKGGKNDCQGVFIVSISIPAKNNRDLAEDPRIPEKKSETIFQSAIILAFFLLHER